MKIQKSDFANSGIKISRLGFGAWGLSGIFEQVPEKDLIRSVFNCLEKGINFIDTARDYGDS
jgi:aryl-alcohol dehydrogenase-like predicted oxidoreductase